MFDYIVPVPSVLIDHFDFDFDDLSLHGAILRGEKDKVLDLLKPPIVINVNEQVAGYTPLEVAVLVGDPEILRALLACRNVLLDVSQLRIHTLKKFPYPYNVYGVVAEFLRCNRLIPSEPWVTYMINLLHVVLDQEVSWFGPFSIAFKCETRVSLDWAFFLLKQDSKRVLEAFECACRENDEKLMEFLIGFIGEDIEKYRNDKGQTVLYIALQYQNIMATQRLLQAYRNGGESKLDINHVDDEGETPLSFMLNLEFESKDLNSCMECIKIVLQGNPDVNYGRTPPLIGAAYASYAYEDTRMVELLLALPQTRVDIKEMPGCHSALQVAARAGNTKVVELLLNTPKTPKCSITDKDANGLTTLHHAVEGAVWTEGTEEGREKCRNTLKFLLQQEEKWGEVLQISDVKGNTLLDCARKDDETLCLLRFKEIKADDLAKLNEMKEFEAFRKLPHYKGIVSPENKVSDAVKFMQIVDLFHEEFQNLRVKKAKETKELEFLPKVDESKIEAEKYDQIYTALKNLQDEYCRIKFLEDPHAIPRAEAKM